jgi:hypothetical protein
MPPLKDFKVGDTFIIINGPICWRYRIESVKGYDRISVRCEHAPAIMKGDEGLEHRASILNYFHIEVHYDNGMPNIATREF